MGQYADVVVRFDTSGCRLVFWRGTSYVPCWVTENGIWYNNEFCETIDSVANGACEPISDKQCRYSHVRILESHDARVVVHWRYALTDVDYRLAHRDEQTGWHDWADEYYIIYPDLVAVRKIVLWTSRPDLWHEFQEAIVVNQPGTRPDDHIEPVAVTLANLEGETKEYRWTDAGTPGFDDKPRDACIETINLKADYRPFVVVTPEGASIASFGGAAPGSLFNCWDHWPVSQDASLTRVTSDFDRPSHSSLSWLVTPREPAEKGWAAHAKTDQSITKLLLHGMTDKTAVDLVPLARSWLMAPELTLLCEGYSSRGYDPSERAYVLTREVADGFSRLQFELAADAEHPVANPAVIVEDWGETEATIKVSRNGAAQPTHTRTGHRIRLEGTDLVAWIRTATTVPVRVEITNDTSGAE
jgi:hypothetical protein